MAVSNEQILSWLQANPTATDADIFSAMQQYGVAPDQLAAATGKPLENVQSRYTQQLQSATSMSPVAPAAPVTSTPVTQMPTQPGGTSGTGLINDILNNYNNINRGIAAANVIGTGINSVANTSLPVLNLGGADSILKLGGDGGLFNFSINPASLALAGFGAFVGNREAKAEARREYDRQLYNAAKADLMNRGVNPEELYSPANIEEWLTDYTVFNDPTVTPEQVAQQKQDEVIREHANAILTSQQTPIDASQYPQRDMGSTADITKGIDNGSLNVIMGTDGGLYAIDKEGYVAPYSPQTDTGGGGGGDEFDTLEPDASLAGGLPEEMGLEGGFDYTVYGDNDQVDPNALPRTNSIVVWRHTNPDGSVVAGDPMGEIWYEKPPETDTTDEGVVVTPGTGSGTTGGDTTGTGDTGATGGTGGTGGSGNGTGGGSGVPTTPVLTMPSIPTVGDTVEPPARGPGESGPTTGIGGPGTGNDVAQAPRQGMLGLGATESTRIAFPELYQLSDQPFTLVGNLLSYRRGMFS